jgi:hypothetical protein
MKKGEIAVHIFEMFDFEYLQSESDAGNQSSRTPDQALTSLGR